MMYISCDFEHPWYSWVILLFFKFRKFQNRWSTKVL